MAEVRVVWSRLAAYHDGLLGLLDDDETTRVARYRHEADRQRFVLAAALLHLELGAATGRDPAGQVVDRTCPRCGRPHGAPRPLTPGWWASVSHAGDVAVVALTTAGRVGVDVEAPREVDAATMEQVLQEAELAWVDADPAHRAERFTALWTAKEAVVKALGTGLPDLAEVELDAADGYRVLRLPRAEHGLRVAHHRVAADVVVAVAVSEGSGAVRVEERVALTVTPTG